MNDDDLTALRNQLPAPSDPMLSRGRRQQLREHLMQEIRWDGAAEESGTPSRRPSRKLGWVALPVLAGGLALALVLPTGSGPDGAGTAAKAAAGAPGSPSSTPTRALPADATQALDQIATVADSTPAGSGDYVYVKVMTGAISFQVMPDGSNKYTSADPHTQELWKSTDGSKPGLMYSGIKGQVNTGRADGGVVLPAEPGTVYDPTVSYLQSLPTDPQALLNVVYDATKAEKNPPNQRAFKALTGMLQWAPPQVAATIFKAAEKIPGVTLVNDVTDAAGRHGIGVGVVDSGARNLWVFDKDSMTYLGARWETTSASGVGPAGTVIDEEAVLQRTLVSRVGDRAAQ
jgi:hypothetical protein